MHSFLLRLCLALAATHLVAADGDAPSEVLSLGPDSFASTVNPEPLILVEFFAPWCGHCKALAPHYDEASVALKPKGIKLAKVDCVEHAELCQSHGVTGYPTLKVFRNGTPSDYQGPRKADGIISYMVKQSLPAVTTVTQSNIEEFKKADKLVIVAYLASDSEEPASEFKAAAEAHRDDYLFGLSIDPEVAQAAGLKTPAIVLYRSFDEPEILFPGHAASASSPEIAQFIKENQTPLVDEVSQENYAAYAQSGLPLAYLFIEPDNAKKPDFVAELKQIARKHKGKVNFVTIDSTKFYDHAKALNLNEEKWPAFVIQDLEKQLKYPLAQDKELTSSAIAEFSEQYVDGKLEPVLKSEPIPASQDESVYTLVGKNFDSVVFDDSKDVFVEFYAPWCGHCKRLKPTWDTLGDRYKTIKDRIVIAKMDATENDLPPSVPFRVSGFPTLKFKPAGGRNFVDYEGDRSLESLIEFVEAKAKNSLEQPKPSSSAEETTHSPEATVQAPIEDHHEHEHEHEHDEL